MRARSILRYSGNGPAPEADVAQVRALDDAVVVDSSARMLLVEADPEVLQELVGTLADWVMGPDRAYAVPDPRERVERPPR